MTDKSHILIVDDEPNVRLVFRMALESAGYALSMAEDGRAALEQLGRTKTDLVLLDLQMPGVDGMETLRQLRARGTDVPVVIVTAHGTIPDAVEAMKLGAIDFLTKPLSPASLRRAVADVLERNADKAIDFEPSSRQESPAAVAITVAAPAVDLTAAKRALNRREFDKAAEVLELALDQFPDSAEAHTLLGVLYEGRGQDHAAYHAYKAALQADPQFGPARDNLRRYCERFGLDPNLKAINPAAE